MTRSYRWILVAFTLIALASTRAAAQTAPPISNCPMFPADNVWNTPVDGLPVDPNSAAYLTTIGPSRYLHPDFGAGLYAGGPIGIPYNIVAGSQSKVPVSFQYAEDSDPGPYPIPAQALIEGGASSTGDRHVIVVDKDNCLLYETWSSYPQSDGSWQAGSGAIFNLKSDALRTGGLTSADAAGLPILPGLVRYDEVAAGEIRHALRFTVSQTRKAYLWPGRHYASSLTGSNYPPMGQRFRLKASFDTSAFSPETRVILTALKKYGMFLADNGSAWYISGVPDDRWNNDVLVSEFARVHGSDFEAVDETSFMVDPDSGQARQQTAGDTGAPSVPTGLAATVLSPNQITLTWLASKDNVGVTGYRVYRNGSAVASSAGTSYLDAQLAPATSYSYKVVAHDAAGNSSAQSAGVTRSTWPLLSTKFKVGGKVRATTSASVYTQPGGTALGTQRKGALGTVTAGPTYYNAAWWWKVDFGSAPDGWVSEARMTSA